MLSHSRPCSSASASPVRSTRSRVSGTRGAGASAGTAGIAGMVPAPSFACVCGEPLTILRCKPTLRRKATLVSPQHPLHRRSPTVTTLTASGPTATTTSTPTASTPATTPATSTPATSDRPPPPPRPAAAPPPPPAPPPPAPPPGAPPPAPARPTAADTLHAAASAAPGDARSGLSDRATAAWVGALFLVATVAFGTADALIGGVLSQPGYLDSASEHRGALGAGAVLAFVQGVAIVGIAVLMYPILRRHHEQRLGMTYLAFRVGEFAATLAYVAVPLVVLQLAGGLRDGTVVGGTARQLEAMFTAQHGVTIVMIYLVTSFGGSALSIALFRTRLIPRAIAVLGVIGYPVLLAGAVLAVFGVGDVSHGAGIAALVPGG